ncbi:hypothetical protein NIE79_002241 [Micromonospora sp. NIE79]|uniref:Uncharacterized protein n=1 Tax=Micromonospora trifolii TaxID=2911208 RepID=A0ABS9N2A5_9ACTN|nr:hypothetical protein [Micromonospora trifolii]MCG5444097.1 hypothetical protein [Micromonospora trifolii]
MPSDLWVSMVSLGGVVLGGALSFGVQQESQRSAERAEERRRGLALAERLAPPERFIEVTAERLPDGESVRDHLEANRPAFLDVARVAVG